MKRITMVLIFSLFLIFSIKPVEAGISLGKGGITLQAGQTEEMCDVWIYAVQDGGTFHVETTGDLKPLTVSIEPNDFALDSVDCPGETNARRACIAQTCLYGDQSSCKIVCVTFTAPMLIEWNPEKVVYRGSILNNVKLGVATGKEPYEFSVHVEPLDMKPVVAGITAAVIIIAIVLYLFVRPKVKKKIKRRKR